jgi:CubicO group peptidase (beta-lactamase class C family)
MTQTFSLVLSALLALVSSSAIADPTPPSPNAIDSVLFPKKSAWTKTDAALVMLNGKILYERYGNGYGPETKHLSWSMAKTVGGILAGIAIDRGYLKVEDPVRKWIPEFKGTATVLDVLQMSSGADFQEEYFGIPVRADVVRMLYLEGPKVGMADYVADRPLRAKDGEPGKHFYYSSGDANLVTEILRRAMPKKVYESFPWDALFNPLGIPNAVFERDAHGTFAASSYVYMTAREFAKLGELVAGKGVYRGKRIIPESYFKLMTEVAPGVNVAAVDGTDYTVAYSAMARTNLPIPGRGCGSEYADLPLDSIYLFGHQGQVVTGSPSTKLVMVRLATDRGASTVRGKFFTATRAFLNSQGRSVDTAMPTNHDKCITALGQAKRFLEARRKVPLAEYKKTPALIRQLGAKEFCSCIFVANRTDAECRSDLKMTLPILPSLAIDVSKSRIVAAMSGSESVAVYEGPRFGCRLVTSVSLDTVEAERSAHSN